MAVNYDELYSFSDDFLNTIKSASEQSQKRYYAPQIDEEADSEEEQFTPPEEDDNDIQSRYDELQAENESLRREYEDYKFSNNPLVQQDELLGGTESDPQSVINMLLGDEINTEAQKSDLSSFNLKSPNVNVANTDNRLTNYLNRLPADLKKKAVITSGNDQQHAKGSLHYNNKALDLRYFPEIHDYIKNDPLAQRMGISVLDPNHGTAKHTHVQVKKYGGDGDKKKEFKKINPEDIKPSTSSTAQINKPYNPENYPENMVYPPVTVVTHKDKDTREFYKALQENDPYEYSAFMDMGKRYGFPKIIKHEGKYRANYNPFFDNINIKDTGFENNAGGVDMDVYLQELAHKIQWDKNWIGSTAKFLTKDIFDDEITRYNRDPKTVEYEAHKVIYPKLKKEYWNNILYQPDYIGMKKYGGKYKVN